MGRLTPCLRVRGEAGRTDWLVVLVPSRCGTPVPTVERLSPTSARVTLGSGAEMVHLGTTAQSQPAVDRGGLVIRLIEAGQVKPLDQVQFGRMPGTLDRGGQ